MTDREWKLLELLNAAREHLKKKEIDNSRGDAEALLSKVLNLPRIQLYVQHDRPMKSDEIAAYRTLLSRRSQREPLQLILGSVEFCGVPIQIAPGLLIPRPETEELVELAVNLAGNHVKSCRLRILDIGTGTGCIAIALAKQLSLATVDAVDVDFEAVRCASANARQNGLQDRVNIMTADVFAPNFVTQLHSPDDIVISNPPYVSDSEYESLAPEVKNFEERRALTAGGDGLNFYRRISELIPTLLSSQGTLLLEIGDTQGTEVRRLVSAAMSNLTLHRDLSGHDRFVIGRFQ